jgi:SAM-dependent methyltransferase
MQDAAYLRQVQYRDAANLDTRARLHRKYGRGDWFPWLAAQVDWRPGLRVLEVGCGAGWFWEEAGPGLPDGLDVTLSDLSDGMLAEALDRVQGLRRDWTVGGRVADVAALPFADRAFDVVLAAHMLYHLPQPGQGAAEIARVLKPDGVALIATNGAAMLKQIFAIQAAVWPGHGVGPAHLRFGLENGPAVLGAAFGSVDLRRYDDDLVCTDPADVEAYLRSSPPAASADTAGLARLRQAIAKAFADGDGTLAVTKDVGVFVCRQHRRRRTDAGLVVGAD